MTRLFLNLSVPAALYVPTPLRAMPGGRMAKAATTGLKSHLDYASAPNLPEAFRKADWHSPASAPAAAHRLAQGWHGQLGGQRKAAVNLYTRKRTAGQWLNNYARSSGQKVDHPRVHEVQRKLDQAMERARVRPAHGLIVHRGTSGWLGNHFHERHETPGHPEGPMIKDQFHEKGYLSTTLSHDVAHHFAAANMHNRQEGKAPVTVHNVIHIPHGAQAGAIGNIGAANHEHEVLGRRGLVLLHHHMEEHEPPPIVLKRHERLQKAETLRAGRENRPAQTIPAPRHFVLHSSVIGHHDDGGTFHRYTD